jgi:hypothetical protein
MAQNVLLASNLLIELDLGKLGHVVGSALGCPLV